MDKQQDRQEQKNITEGKILNFLYNVQNRRRINPIYGIFTKEGLAYIVAGYYLFGIGNSGAFMLVIYIGIGSYIYKNRLNYRFYHHDRLHFFHMLTEYLEHRSEVPDYEPMVNYFNGKKDFAAIEKKSK